MLDSKSAQSIGIGSALVIVNIALIWILAQTFVPALVAYLFTYAIVGVLVFGAILTAGTWLSSKGIRNDNNRTAFLGVSLLQLGYGAFGALAVAFVPEAQGSVLLITAVVTALIAALVSAYVYGTGKNFRAWQRYASYCFFGVIGLALVGTFAAPVLLFAFVLATAGFLMYLVYEVWAIRTSPNKVLLNGVGIYSAFMGVFVHILRIVVEMYMRRRN